MILGVTETKHLSKQEKEKERIEVFSTWNHFYSTMLALLVGRLMAIRSRIV